MRKEEREMAVEDSGVNNDAQASGLGNYAGGGSEGSAKNVGLGYKEYGDIDVDHFEIEVSVRNTNEDVWVYSSGLEEIS